MKNTDTKEKLTPKYKGFQGKYQLIDNKYFGKLVGLRDVVTFVATKEEDIIEEFKQSVDDYLEMLG